MLRLIRAMDMNFKSVREYYDSFKKKSEINSFAINSIIDGEDKYFNLIANSYEILYYLIDDNNPNYIIGFGSIENSGIRDYHLLDHNDGNISYGIRPVERNKGYGTILLKLLLQTCEELGMPEVCISCTEENITSKRIIEKNNGLLERTFIDNWTNKPSLKYWIKLNPELIPSKEKSI